jgi:GntR family transcriptional regulator / MocR family aminotransferase
MRMSAPSRPDGGQPRCAIGPADSAILDISGGHSDTRGRSIDHATDDPPSMTKHAGGALLQSVRIERGSGVPIASQLAHALRELMLTAALRPGDRLPSSRTLARDLGVSRTTVVDVYDHLTAEGLIVSRVGAGAYVSEALRATVAAAPPPAPTRPPARLARLAADASEQFFPRIIHPASPRAFTTGTPAYDAFPLPLWAQLTARALRRPRHGLMRYPEAGGLPELREAIAGHLRMNRGLACRAEEVFVVAGAQEAFNRIATLLIDPGDRVWFENPGHIGARNSFVAAGATLVPVPVDDQGLDVAAGLAAAPSFRLAFATPAHQQPLGVTMALERRLELLAAAEAADAWVVEDDYDGEFWYTGHMPPTLRGIDVSGRVIYVGSFSKSLFPALRIGFLLAPPGLAEVVERVGSAVLHDPPTPLQATLAAFIREGHLAAHIRRMRRIYAERHDALLDAAARRLAGRLEVRPTHSGLQTVGLFLESLDEARVAALAAARGVTVAPLARFCIAPIPLRGLALGFSAVPPRELAAGVEALRDAIDAARRD